MNKLESDLNHIPSSHRDLILSGQDPKLTVMVVADELGIFAQLLTSRGVDTQTVSDCFIEVPATLRGRLSISNGKD